jgi:hypothetical protein
MFVIPAGVWTRAETNAHVFDAFWHARARPRHSAHARVCDYISHPGLDHTPPHVTDLTRAQVRRSLPRERGASGRASHDHRRPAKPATPRPTLGLASTNLGEAPRTGDWTLPHRRRRIDVAGLQPVAVACGPSSPVSRSSIPCTYSVLSTPVKLPVPLD